MIMCMFQCWGDSSLGKVLAKCEEQGLEPQNPCKIQESQVGTDAMPPEEETVEHSSSPRWTFTSYPSPEGSQIIPEECEGQRW